MTNDMTNDMTTMSDQNSVKDQLVIIPVQFRIYDPEELATNLGPEPGEGSILNPRYLDHNCCTKQ